MQCEKCTNEHDIEKSHSLLIVLQVAKKEGSFFYQCEQGNEHNTLTYQHWHCTYDCLKNGAIDCIENHYDLSLLRSDVNVNFHKLIMNMKKYLHCDFCGGKIDEAYRFCLTYATPVNFIVGKSDLDLGGWCCSLDHAQKDAINLVKGVRL